MFFVINNTNNFNSLLILQVMPGMEIMGFVLGIFTLLTLILTPGMEIMGLK